MTQTGERRRPAEPGRRPGRDRAERAQRTERIQRAKARRGRRSVQDRRRITRPVKRKEMRRRWVAVLSVLTVVALVYLLWFSSMLGVRQVDVVGASSVPGDQIRAAAAVPDQKPMLRLDTDEIRDRVAQMPGIATVDVSRSWPSTLEITVTERVAIAFFDSGPGGDGVHLVDGGGVVFKTVKERPAGLPELKLPLVSADDPVTRAVTGVLGVIPQQLLKQVTTATAKTPGSVEFALADGKTVRWGTSADTERKAKVLAALLTREGKVFDVSAPDLPTVS
ncbi:cell division protein FtsQ [Amycolatopsis coloradensis]|uniref:Cell division protein FtsQ n=1 Tax=Amycolatopsis coloradensis TaxID=76021 RepID=A0A1R0L3Q0_9PSEU|nr:FtsQ-type POTRA domain-containing protein [Amycolatopsis coloradensis]OLZ57276.1 cell division protein FtsQ [Amycolatopsis coloradensis]